MNKILFEIWDFVKKNFTILVIGVVFLLLYFRGCGGKSGEGKTTSDTVYSKTTQLQPIVVQQPYTPQAAGTTYVTLPATAQGVTPASTVTELVNQVNDLSKRIEQLGREYYAINRYKDSIQLRDSSGTRVGVVNLDQTVSENILKSTLPSYQLSLPITTRTITNTIYPPPKNQIYLGVGAETLMNTVKLQNLSTSLLFKNKRDNILSLSGVYNIPSKQPGIGVGYYIKLHL